MKKLPKHWLPYSATIISTIVTFISIGILVYLSQSFHTQQNLLTSENEQLDLKIMDLEERLAQTSLELTELKNVDQFKRNEALQKEIQEIQKTYKATVAAYEDILVLKEGVKKPDLLDAGFAKALTLLSQRNYASASATLATLQKDIEKRRQELAAATGGISTANLPVDKTPPANGYRRQVVEVDGGSFVVDIIAGDLSSTRVQVETASAGDCKDNCPVASLSDYVSRSGGYAGINGPYFCPAEYPSCAGKTNSFDTLLMNKNKTYFNSDNNVYSVVPVAVFSGSSANFIGQSQNWGRDTGVDAVIASQPMLLSNGEITYGGDTDPKRVSRGSRSFLAASDGKVYIGVVRGASVGEVAKVLKAMGIKHALNLDSGGSTALMFNGKYLAGPGRNTPFGIVLVRK